MARDKLLQDGNTFRIGNRSDYISYYEFLKYFKDLTTITKHHLIIGINFTYGWMPTIFDFCSDNFNEALVVLNNAKNGVMPKVKELDVLKGLFNNSLVGTSKLLHFINSDKFAIWDSRVYHYLTGKKTHGYRIGNFKAYLSFLTLCDFLTQGKEYEKVHNSICNKIGYSMTKFRTAELIMYMNDKVASVRRSL
jgi:hypothetical protein